MPTQSVDRTWMKNHPLEGDDIVTGFYNFLVKRNPKTMKPCKDILVPDTVVFEHNFPRGWYTTDIKAREVMRKQGKELDASTIEHGFVDAVPDSCPIVATYLCTCEEDLGNGESETRALVEVFNKDTIGEFLARKTKREGILQKFVQPKSYHNSVIKAIWSPRVCMVQRRTNKYPINDKKRAENDPFSTTVTYEGPTYLSEEGSVSANIAMEVKKICGCIVQHFYYTEHKFITRMVLYLKSDRRDRLWFLWCGSLRVSDRTATSEMPVNLITNFAEPDDKDDFDEDALLWEADRAFLRATNDEMFYETYMKNVRLVSSARGEAGGKDETREVRGVQGPRPDEVRTAAEVFDWNGTAAPVWEAYARLCVTREGVLTVFEDLFYRVQSHIISRTPTPNILAVPVATVNALTPDGVSALMALLHLPYIGTSEEGEMQYVVGNNTKSPVTKLRDDALAWIEAHYDAKLRQLRQVAEEHGEIDDINTLQQQVDELLMT